MPFILIFNHPAIESIHQFEEEQTTSIQDIPYTEKDVSRDVKLRLQELLEDSEDYDEFIQRCMDYQLPEEFIEFLNHFKVWLELKLTSRLDRAILRLDSTVMNAMHSLEFMDDTTATVTVNDGKKKKAVKKK